MQQEVFASIDIGSVLWGSDRGNAYGRSSGTGDSVQCIH